MTALIVLFRRDGRGESPPARLVTLPSLMRPATKRAANITSTAARSRDADPGLQCEGYSLSPVGGTQRAHPFATPPSIFGHLVPWLVLFATAPSPGAVFS